MREVKSLIQQGATYGNVLTLAAQHRITPAALPAGAISQT